jgi:hypothetical protein
LFKNLWHGLVDLLRIWFQPVLGLAILVSGTFHSLNFADIAKKHPGWTGLADFGSTIPWLAILLVSAVLALFASVLIALDDGTIKSLKKTVEQHRAEVNEIGNSIIILFDGLLLNVARRLKLQQGSQARLSLYVHDSELDIFIACGRYSPNPVFSSPGRTTYPDDEGCIGMGWKNGWHFDDAVPANGVARSKYNTKTYNIPEDTNAAVRMKSRLYAVRRLDDAMGMAVAVLVFEAVDPNGFPEQRIRDTLDGVADDFARVIDTLRDYVPNPAQAEKAGL